MAEQYHIEAARGKRAQSKIGSDGISAMICSRNRCNYLHNKGQLDEYVFKHRDDDAITEIRVQSSQGLVVSISFSEFKRRSHTRKGTSVIPAPIIRSAF